MRFSTLALSLSILSALLIYSAGKSVHAQTGPQYKSGLNYTTFGQHKSAPPAEKREAAAALEPAPRKILPMARPLADQLAAQEPAAGTPSAPVPQEKEETRIWNKYKALATGQNKETAPEAPKTLSPQHPLALETTQKNHIGMQSTGGMKTWSAPVQPAQQKKINEAPAEATGIAALLKKWQTNKAQQSELRTKHFPVPQGLGTVNEKPAAPQPPAAP